MDKPVTLSLIVPVYNTAQWLDRCFNSIQNQKFADYEVLVIDDGSTDGSGQLCDAWAAADPRFRVFHQPNLGVSEARNRGLDMAKGEWVWFVDSDDWLMPGALETLARYASDADANVLVFGLIEVDSQGEESGRIMPPANPDCVHLGPLQSGNPLYCATHLVRRAAVTRLRFEPGLAMHEDRLFFYKLCMEQRRHTSVLDVYPYAYHVARPGSAVQTVSVGKLLRSNDVFAQILDEELLLDRPFPAYYDYINHLNACVAAIIKTRHYWSELPRFVDRMRVHPEHLGSLGYAQRLKRCVLLAVSCPIVLWIKIRGVK